jgi:hypothetical protein
MKDFFDRLVHEMQHFSIIPQTQGAISAYDSVGQAWIKFGNPKEAHQFFAGIVDANLAIEEKTWDKIEEVLQCILSCTDPKFVGNKKRLAYHLENLVNIAEKSDKKDILEIAKDLLEETQSPSKMIMASTKDLNKLQKYTIRLKNNCMAASLSKYRVALILAYAEECQDHPTKTAGNMFGPFVSKGYDSIDGPYNRLDLPEEERVFPFDGPYGIAEGLENRSDAIKQQVRYNPEYEKGERQGIYFDYVELSWLPTKWWKIFTEQDSPYKIRQLLLQD